MKEIVLELAETDLIISIESFRRSQKIWCLPQSSIDKSVKCINLYHPLLEDPVTNDVLLKKNCIITGSNASGKSTFIKALAINEIMAHGIYTCTAEEMICCREIVIL